MMNDDSTVGPKERGTNAALGSYDPWSSLCLLFTSLGSLFLGDWTFEKYWEHRESWAYRAETIHDLSLVLAAGMCGTLLLSSISIVLGILRVRKIFREGDATKWLASSGALSLILLNLLVATFFVAWAIWALSNVCFPSRAFDVGEQMGTNVPTTLMNV